MEQIVARVLTILTPLTPHRTVSNVVKRGRKTFLLPSTR